jgi:hypothetical protein
VDEVVYLNAGLYYVSGDISIPSNTVLRGAGIDNTRIYKTGTGRGIFTFGSMPSWGGSGNWIYDEWEALSANGTKDATSVTVSDSSRYEAGQLVLISEGENGNSDVAEVGSQGYHAAHKMRATSDWPPNDSGEIGQMNVISSVDGNTINLETPLYYTYSTSRTASIGRTTVQATNAGLEDLTILRASCASDTSDSEADGEIFFGRATNCWIQNVKAGWKTSDCANDSGSPNNDWGGNLACIYGVTGPAINLGMSYRCNVENNWLTMSCSYTSGGGGYQMVLGNYSSNILIQNNIFHQGTPNVHFNCAGAGSVLGYNFIDVSVTNGGTSWAVYNVASHVATSHMILFEGNQVTSIEADTTWGNSIYFFLLRNHIDAIQTEWVDDDAQSCCDSSMSTDNRSAVDLNSDSFYWSIVGNVLGRTGDSYPGGSGVCSGFELGSGGERNDCCTGVGTGPTCGYWTDNHGGTASIFRDGVDLVIDSTASNKVLIHGNYDYFNDETVWCTAPSVSGITFSGVTIGQ